MTPTPYLPSLDPTHRIPKLKPLAAKGGLKGGKARAAKLSPRKRRQIAKKAAKARRGA